MLIRSILTRTMLTRTALARTVHPDLGLAGVPRAGSSRRNSSPPRFMTRFGLVLVGMAMVLALAACGGGDDDDDDGGGRAAEPAPDSGQSAKEPAPVAAATDNNDASITGTVTFKGDAPEMAVLDMAADPVCEGKNQEEPKRRQVLVLGDDQGIANVLVQIKGDLPAMEHEASPRRWSSIRAAASTPRTCSRCAPARL